MLSQSKVSPQSKPTSSKLTNLALPKRKRKRARIKPTLELMKRLRWPLELSQRPKRKPLIGLKYPKANRDFREKRRTIRSKFKHGHLIFQKGKRHRRIVNKKMSVKFLSSIFQRGSVLPLLTSTNLALIT